MNQFLKNLLVSNRVLTSLVIGSLVTVNTPQFAQAKLEDSPKIVVDEVWQIVNNEFVDKDFNHVDWLYLRQELLERDYSSPEEAYRTIRETLKQLGDPYTRFLEPKEFESLTNQTSGEITGIGITIEIDSQSKELVVVEPVRNSPAEAAGIQPGDRLRRIDGRNTILMSIDQASQAIRGEIGTDVELEIYREGEGVIQLTVTRAQIELPSLTYNVKQEGNMLIGYIKLDEFSSHAAEQMKEAIENLSDAGVTAFVLDLRGNPGGLLYASVDIARLWLEEGVIVKTLDQPQTCSTPEAECGYTEIFANGTAITDLPLVILVDGYSASASEILAGALQENGRATLVGTRTFGKGTVQSVHTLSDGSGLAVTISRYYPPSGTNINKKGINPDIPVELTQTEELIISNDPSLLATQADPQYLKAIAFLTSSYLPQTSLSP
ncbi:MAG: PDZ domain-containing protein [Gloeocapsa sp. DLM2.Bin57]|nr:MAG: PDZ domain-containing protein [Gloeocapsa sp. DLM2.Bin57]